MFAGLSIDDVNDAQKDETIVEECFIAG